MPHALIAEHPLSLSPSLAARCGVDEALVLARLWQWADVDGELTLPTTQLRVALPGPTPDWALKQLDSLRDQGLLHIVERQAQRLQLRLATWPGDGDGAPPLAVSPTLVSMLGAAEACLLSGLDLLAQTAAESMVESTWEALGARFSWWDRPQLRQLLERLCQLGVLWGDHDPAPAAPLRLSLVPPTAEARDTRAQAAPSATAQIQELALELHRQKDIPTDFTLEHGTALSAAEEHKLPGKRLNQLRRQLIGLWQRQLAATDSKAAAEGDSDDAVDRVFHLFARLFPQQFRKAWPTLEALREVKQMWRTALAAVPAKALLAAARAAALQSSYLPSLAEVARRCTTPHADTLPSEPEPSAPSAPERRDNLARLRSLRQSLRNDASSAAR